MNKNPYIYKNWRQKNREAAGRSRNTALNDVYKKFGLPKNMANKEIGQRVKYHNWVVGEIVTGSHNNGSNSQIIKAHKNEINTFTKFLNNDTLLTESKRKSLITLAIQLGDKSVIALRNPVVIRYLMKVQYLVTGSYSLYEFTTPHTFTRQLKALGKYREDAAMVSVLKKRINLMKKLYKNGGFTFLSNNLYNDLHNRGIDIDDFINHREVDSILYPDGLKKIMDTLLPLPPHTNSTRKTAATRIQKTARRVIKRKKASTTIQKTVRGMINRKTVRKMKTEKNLRNR
jgi:hypothetical protein